MLHFRTFQGQIVLALLLIAILLLPNFFVALFAKDLDGVLVKKTVYLAVSLFCVLLPALFFKKKIYFVFMGIFSLLLAPIEIASVCFCHTTTSFMMVDTILNTDIEEAGELLSYSAYLFLIWLLVLGCYFFFTFKYVDNEFFFSKRIRKIFLVAGAVLLVAGCAYFFILARRTKTSEETTFKDNLIDTKDFLTLKFQKIYPFSVYLSACDVLQHNMDVREAQKRVKDFCFGLKPKVDNDEEVYVLVIGETARANNMGLYGYERNTTPLLSRRRNLVAYDHMVTLANLTSNSIPIIMTRANAEKSDVANRERSVSEAFSEAGFFTAWITDQEVTAFQRRIMEECDTTVVNGGFFSADYVYDMDMLPSLQSVLKREGHKKFIVIHTQGSHFRYNQRYPSEFEKFKPCFDNTMDYVSINKENRSLLVNAYDNSILYTDFFLSNLMVELDKSCGTWAMLFLSDHGENLFDNQDELVLHGTLVVSEYEARIPFIVAYSDGYQNKYPEKVRHLMENRNKNITSEVVFHSLLDMADIRSSAVVADSLSVFSARLVSKESTYIMNGNRDLVLFDFKRLDK